MIIGESFQSFLVQKCQIFADSSLLNVRISCFSLSLMTVNEEFLYFGIIKYIFPLYDFVIYCVLVYGVIGEGDLSHPGQTLTSAGFLQVQSI